MRCRQTSGGNQFKLIPARASSPAVTVFESSSSANLSSNRERAELGLEGTEPVAEPDRLRYAERGSVGRGASYGSYLSLLPVILGDIGGVVANGGGDEGAM